MAILKVTVHSDSNGLNATMPPENLTPPPHIIFPTILYNALVAAFPSTTIQMSNRSVAGEDSIRTLNGDPGWLDPIATVMSQENPNISVLMIGTNDAANILPTDSQAVVDAVVVSYETNMRAIISAIVNHSNGSSQYGGHPLLVLVSPPPAATKAQVDAPDTVPMYYRDERALIGMRDVCTRLAAEYTLPVVNFHELVSNTANWLNTVSADDTTVAGVGLVGDGVHITQTARQMLSNELVTTLRLYQNADGTLITTPHKERIVKINGADAYIRIPDGFSYINESNVLMAIHGSGRQARSYRNAVSDANGVDFYAHQRDLSLQNGYIFCVISNDPDCWGTDAGLSRINALYDYMVSNYNTDQQFALWSTSAGGVLMHRMVKDYPSRVLGCLGMFPVYDLDVEWSILQSCRDACGNNQVNYSGKNPPSFAASLTTKRYRIDHGDADTSVPLAGNSQALADTVNALGGSITLNVIAGGIHDTNLAYYNDSAINTFLQSIKTPLEPQFTTPTLFSSQQNNLQAAVRITGLLPGDSDPVFFYKNEHTQTELKPHEDPNNAIWKPINDYLEGG